MKLPDLNVLLYAVNRDSPQHERARRWIESSFESDETVAFAWVALLGFVRLATRRGILPAPLAIEDALEVVSSWISHPAAQIVHPGERHLSLLARLLIAADRGGNLTTDAHLAALAIEHGASLTTFDRDFARFAGLELELLEA